LVLLSSPPVLGYVDMLQTAQYCQGIVLIEKIDQITKSKLSEANTLLTQLKILGIVADGGEASEAKLRQIYEPQWQSMLKELPPVDAHRH
jgi:polysaccharide biosynthesis transport protein